MRFDIITGFPGLMRGPLNESILRQAKKKKLVQIRVHDLRRYARDKHRTIDDSPYGGGAGMVLKPEPIFECIEHLSSRRKYDEIVFLTPDGETFNQRMAMQLSLKTNLLLVCGHYKGIDERVRERLITKEISMGDYVLTGGEIPALAVVDAVVRLIPGVVGDAESLLSDSFQDGLLGCPQYTRPPDYRGMKVPPVLVSGNHKDVDAWRQRQRIERTRARRRELL